MYNPIQKGQPRPLIDPWRLLASLTTSQRMLLKWLQESDEHHSLIWIMNTHVPLEIRCSWTFSFLPTVEVLNKWGINSSILCSSSCTPSKWTRQPKWIYAINLQWYETWFILLDVQEHIKNSVFKIWHLHLTAMSILECPTFGNSDCRKLPN